MLNALRGIALDLISQVVASLIAICGKFIDKKAIRTIFCLVYMFNHVANKFFFNLKNIVCIKKEIFSNFLTLVHVKPHNYVQNNKEKDIMFLSLFLFSSLICSPLFVRSAYNTANVSCKHFVALPAYQVHAKKNKNELQKKHSNTLGKQAIYHLFLYKANCFSCYYNLPIVATK